MMMGITQKKEVGGNSVVERRKTEGVKFMGRSERGEGSRTMLQRSPLKET